MRHTVSGSIFAGAILVFTWAPTARAQVAAGGEFRANTYTPRAQITPDVAVGRLGDVIVVWESDRQDGSDWGVYGQRYDAAGLPRGPEFRVNTFTLNAQAVPKAAIDLAGNFVVAWQSFGQDGSDYGIFAQRFDAAGVRRGGEFRVNDFTAGAQGGPGYDYPNLSVGMALDGRFIVAWQSEGQDGNGLGIYAKRFDAAGAALGGEFRVNTGTLGDQRYPSVAMAYDGSFVVAWDAPDGSNAGVFARRYDTGGAPIGAPFQVNTFTTDNQYYASVTMAANDPGFVVTWASYGQDGDGLGVFAQRYSSAGAPLGGEFRVNSYTPNHQYGLPAKVAADAGGNFVVAWRSLQDGGSGIYGGRGVFAQRFGLSGARRGNEFQVNSYTTSFQITPAVGVDRVGNFTVVWRGYGQEQPTSSAVFGQRFGGLLPTALGADVVAGAGSDGNGVLEPGESGAVVRPTWRNVNGVPLSFGGALSGMAGPGGPSYTINDGAAAYGNVANNATGTCAADCYAVGVSNPPLRPALHWDARAIESILPDALGQQKTWLLHVGSSFTDVARSNPFYRFVETLLHHGVTGGCTANAYCPSDSTTREQMSVFVLLAKEGGGYSPPACTTPAFNDVPASSPFCRWIEELARRSVVGGCGGGAYCPTAAVTREQMSVFVLRTLDPQLSPPACLVPMFADVLPTSPFCRWIEELARRGVVSGCGGGNYCPTAAVTREQMGVFISGTFGLTLYAP